MPQQNSRIEVRIRDRVGVVSEVSREISALHLTIASHQAHVTHDVKGTEISVFRAQVDADETQLARLRQRCSRIKGFIRFLVL